MIYLVSILLVALSALFSGLTLGLLSLDTQSLKRQASLGSKEASVIYPIRKRGNLLLTTLLLGNVAVNTSLSIFLGSIASGFIAGIIATTFIFIFGEIVPQAVMSRHAMWFGSKTAPLVRVLIFIAFPVTFPIAFVLDRFLGEELPTIYSKRELMEIISEHEDSDESPIDQDEERIVHGALLFSHKSVRQIMTPLEKVVMYENTQTISEQFLEAVNEHGYSRYPVFSGSKEHIIGILYAKDLIVENENVILKNAKEAFEGGNLLISKPNDLLDSLLAKMLRLKKHMSIVCDQSGACIGVITLEDIIEEILQHEIEDEDD